MAFELAGPLSQAIFKAAAGTGNYLIEAIAVRCGDDVSVTVGGGTRYHIGAVALAVPRPSLADPARMSASASVVCVTGHKDDELARESALKLAELLNSVVSVSVGLHIDDAGSEDIHILTANFHAVLDQLSEALIL